MIYFYSKKIITPSTENAKKETIIKIFVYDMHI